jgi:hypothetical protein
LSGLRAGQRAPTTAFGLRAASPRSFTRTRGELKPTRCATWNPQYKSLAESGLLHSRRQRALEGAGLAPPASESDASASEGGGGGDDDGRQRRAGAAAIDDFLVTAELLTQQWPGDTVRSPAAAIELKPGRCACLAWRPPWPS